MSLAVKIYGVTRSFPKEELFGLTQQIRRSAVSIPSNIAEGSGRGGTQDYIRFLQIARGSLFEAQTQIELAKLLQFSTESDAAELLQLGNEIERMLNSLITKLGS
jgi:four helix bundle protein